MRLLRDPRLFFVLALLVLAGPVFAALTFPALSGRIVDAAHIMTAADRAAIEPKLKELEDKSGIQLEVATVPSLQGQEIEPFANALFRAWKLGEKTKNNGVLLLVAPNERKVRIEVGYGNEGTLTDALSKIIITNAIVPKFKTGDFSGGISRGVDDIITVLTTDSADWQARQPVRPEDKQSLWDALMPLLIMIAVMIVLYKVQQAGGGRRGGIVFLPTGGGGFRGGGGFGGGGGGFGGGFSGGGGSSGGGGASGGW